MIHFIKDSLAFNYDLLKRYQTEIPFYLDKNEAIRPIYTS